MTTLYRNIPQQSQQPQPLATLTYKDGKRVEFHSETHGVVHGTTKSFDWRYRNYELEIKSECGKWVLTWTPFHTAINWAVERRKLRRYVAEVQSDKVIELAAYSKVDDSCDNSTINEYAVSFYTEVDDEGIPTERKLKLYSTSFFSDASIQEYMKLLEPTCTVMSWGLCNPQFDEF